MIHLSFTYNALAYRGLAIPTKKFLMSGDVFEYRIFLNGSDYGCIFGVGNSWGSEENTMAQQMVQKIGNIIFETR